ncbi:MAG TPA: universal stress protein [Burkholderiales bacterium]|nr:universal stress protein [Burkholderiales bacterium]
MGYKRILVPVDGSATSNAGLREALKLAHGRNAKLCLLHIMDEHVIFVSPEAALNMRGILESMRSDGVKILKRAARLALGKGVRAQTALMESRGLRVADSVVRQAKRWRADIIVMGTHGRRGMNRLIMGSDADLVVRYAGVPVLLVHGRAPAKRKRK